MIDFVIPPMFYTGVYALFALIFALFGGLCAKKYKWQYAITKIAAVALSALLSIVILKSISAVVGDALVDVLSKLEDIAELEEIIASESIMSWVLAIFGVVFAFILFVPTFAVIKAILNLIFKIIVKCIFRAIPEKTEKTASNAAEEIAAGDAASDVTPESGDAQAVAAEDGETALPDSFTADSLSQETADAKAETKEESAVLEPAVTEACAEPVKKKKTNPIIAERGRGWSFLCGAVSGFMVLTVITAPLVCFISDVGGIASAALYASDNDVIAENIDSACDNLGVDIISACGGRLIYDGIGSFSIKEEKVVLGRELEFAEDAADVAFLLTSKEISAHEKSLMIDKAIESFEETSLIPIVFSDLIREASQKWVDGEEYMGSAKPSIGEAGDEVVDELLEGFKNSTPDTMRRDISSVLHLMSSAVDSGALDLIAEGEEADLMKLLENETFLKDVIKVLIENERLSGSVTTVANMGVRMLAQTLNIPENDEEIYDEFISTILTARAEVQGETDAQKVINLAESVKKAYDTAGIELAYGAEYTIAIDLVGKLSSSPTADEIKAMFKNENGELDFYNDLRLSFMVTSSIFDPTYVIINRGISEEGIEELSETVTSKFTSSKMSQTNENRTAELSIKGAEDITSRGVRVVLSDMLIEKKEITDTETEAANLASVISKVLAMVSDLSASENMEINSLMDKLGTLLDSLSESEFIGEKVVANTVTALLQSDFVRDTLGISSHKASTLSGNVATAVKDGDTYRDHLMAIGKTVNVITKKDEVQSTEDVKELILTVTPTTSETLKELVSEEVLTSNGLPEKTSEAISDIFGTMLDEMAEINDSSSDSAYVEKEAEAVSKALDIVTADSEKFKEGMFGTEQEAEAKIKEYTELVSSSEIMTGVLIDAVYGESDTPKLDPIGFEQTLPEHEKNFVVEQLDTLYKNEASSGTSGEELKEYEKLMVSIAAFLNLDVKVEGTNVTLK